MTCKQVRDLFAGSDVPVTTRALRAAVCRHLLLCPACRSCAGRIQDQASADWDVFVRLWTPDDLRDAEFVSTVAGR